MKQKLTILSKTTKAVVIPNTLLKELDNPDSFEMYIDNGKIVLEPLKKEQNDKKTTKIMIDTSLDLYKVDK